MKRLLLGIVISVFMVSLVFAGGSADEAKSMLERAVAYVKANGNEKAFAEVTNRQGSFVDRDLYIFAVDFNGLTIAHGGNAKLVGKDMLGLKDADGKFFIKAFIETAKSKGNGWVDYKWVNPQTNKIENKSTYVQKVDDYFLGCGIYK
ncbi:MAG: histidine kinase [Deltaproteobacteria bacterium HGW-Deltaproteobacteria-21]|nr:MAG: histidine kinase [Deltaproteobacteria bacterium HGW-Deltaproteobacteria-21]